MGALILHGIVLSDLDVEGYGEQFCVASTDISHLVGGRVEGWDMWLNGSGRVMGVVTAAKAIHGPQDCASDADRGLLDLGRGKPIVRATVTLADVEGHWATAIKEGVVGWSGTGAVIERRPGAMSHVVLRSVSLHLHHGRWGAQLCRPFFGPG